MQINVAQLLKQPVGATRQYELQEQLELSDEGVLPVAPLAGTVHLLRTQRGVLVHLQARTQVQIACCRCLEPFTTPVEINFQEEFFPTIDIHTGLPIEVPEDDKAALIDDSHVLDLGEMVRQYLLLSLPMHPLCRQDCAGLCPHCGHNLNEGPCACPPEPVDSRWAALSELLHEAPGG
jgi:uncharacterized protein